MRHYYHSGFSLMELMVTIAIAAILATIALPSFNTMMANNEIRVQANSLISALKYARSEAMRRGEEVKVCTSNTAQTACDATKNWSAGWVAVVSDSSELLRVWDAADRIAEDSGGGIAKYIEYQSDGKAKNLIANGNNAVFVLSTTGCVGENARTVKVKKTGRAAASLSNC